MKFNSRHPGRERSVRKNAIAGTIHFAFRISRAYCTVTFTPGENFGANIFKSQFSSSSLVCNFMREHALPLILIRILRFANNSPVNQQHPARRSSHVRESAGKTSGEISRGKLAPLPGNGRAITTAMPPTIRQDDSQEICQHGRAMAALQLAGRLASCPHDLLATNRKLAHGPSGQAIRCGSRLGLWAGDESVTRGDRRRGELGFEFPAPPLVRPRTPTARPRDTAQSSQAADHQTKDTK